MIARAGLPLSLFVTWVLAFAVVPGPAWGARAAAAVFVLAAAVAACTVRDAWLRRPARPVPAPRPGPRVAVPVVVWPGADIDWSDIEVWMAESPARRRLGVGGGVAPDALRPAAPPTAPQALRTGVHGVRGVRRRRHGAATGAQECRVRLCGGTPAPCFEALPAEGGPPVARSGYFALETAEGVTCEPARTALIEVVGELTATGWALSRRGRAPWDLVFRRDAPAGGS